MKTVLSLCLCSSVGIICHGLGLPQLSSAVLVRSMNILADGHLDLDLRTLTRTLARETVCTDEAKSAKRAERCSACLYLPFTFNLMLNPQFSNS